MKKSFLNASAPFITEMIQVKTEEQARSRMQRAIAGGATAIGLQLHTMTAEYRTEKAMRDLFAAARDLPLYVTNYRTGENTGRSDEDLTEELLLAVDRGATLVDLMGDAFDPSPEELTVRSDAVEKQMRWIEEVHKRGGEVLLSSHIYSFREAERVLEIARAQQKRGADIVKIVTGAETEAEELQNLATCDLLKKELSVPFLFLSTGKYPRLHRTIGPALGVCMWLCFSAYDEFTYPGPPLLENVMRIKHALALQAMKKEFQREAEGIYRLKIPFEDLYTSVFLVQTEDASVLVDCATAAQDIDRLVEPALKRLSLSLSMIDAVIVTHGHSDHIGGLARMLQKAPHLRVISTAEAVYGLEITPLPGHTADLIGVFEPKSGALLTGDGLQGAGIGKYRCSLESKDDYIKTLERIAQDGRVRCILFSHAYEPWNRDAVFGKEDIQRVLRDCKKYGIGESI